MNHTVKLLTEKSQKNVEEKNNFIENQQQFLVKEDNILRKKSKKLSENIKRPVKRWKLTYCILRLQ